MNQQSKATNTSKSRKVSKCLSAFYLAPIKMLFFSSFNFFFNLYNLYFVILFASTCCSFAKNYHNHHHKHHHHHHNHFDHFRFPSSNLTHDFHHHQNHHNHNYDKNSTFFTSTETSVVKNGTLRTTVNTGKGGETAAGQEGNTMTIFEISPQFDEELEFKVPIDFVNQLNAYENLTDVLHNFVEEPLEDDDQQANPLLENRFSERNSYSIPKSAGCMPELQPVKIVNNTDPSIMYIPSCTRIERCGGCCSHPLLACKPTATETVSFQITKTQYTGGSKLKNLGKEIVLVEKHTKCRCDCKIQPEDCQPSQTYSKKECKCVCNNKDEQKKCIKNSSLKLWNSNSCQCQCREFLQCSTGSRFDPNSCKCEVIPLRKRDRLIAEPRSSSLSTTFD